MSDQMSDKGFYFKQVRDGLETPFVWIDAGMMTPIPHGGIVEIHMHELSNAVLYTLDKFGKPFVQAEGFATIYNPWRMPWNRVFIAQRRNINEVTLTTISAVEQNSKFWLVCEEKVISTFTDDNGPWSTQLWGKTLEVGMLVNSLGLKPVPFDRNKYNHPQLKVGQVAFWSWGSGTGAICTSHNPDGSAILSRIYWKQIPARKKFKGLCALTAGEIVKVLGTTPNQDANSAFARNISGIVFLD